MFEIIDKEGTRRKVYDVNGQYFLIYVEDRPGEWLPDRGWQYLPMAECVPADAVCYPPTENRCVACGAIIPEGTQVCRRCGK